MTTEEAILEFEKQLHSMAEIALSALRAQQEVEKNAPLTIDELRRMSGEPVWLVPLGEDFDEGWYIIVSDDKQRLRCLLLYSMLFFEHYGKTWLAYRRKPEEE